MTEILDNKKMLEVFLNELKKQYWDKIYAEVKKNNLPFSRIINLLLNFKELVITFSKTHVVVEYYEKENNDNPKLSFESKIQVRYFDYSQEENINLFEKIIGIEYSSTSGLKLPLSGVIEDLVCPTSNGFVELENLGWTFYTQSAILALNGGFEVPKHNFCRIINGTFFDADESGLKTRRAKLIDFIPILYDDTDDKFDTFNIDLSIYNTIYKQDVAYKFPEPEFYEQEKISIINRFVELYGNKNTCEPEITTFLSKQENEYILKSRFSAKNIYSQKLCEWQSENKPAIQPDFFVLNANGYADIVEFKLPDIKNNSIVGKINRETFSAEIQSYISQTRVYQAYFDDPNNRRWVEEKYGFKVHKPKRFLVVGRRFDFSSDEWQEIKSDYNNLEILTYDDLIDGVIAPLFC